MNFLDIIFISTGLSLLFMTLAWLVALRLNFYSLVDVAWAYNMAAAVGVASLMASGHLQRKLLVCGLLFIWGFRLGTFLLLRLKRHFPEEDSRYKKLRALWPQNTKFKFFLFFQGQALSQPLLCIPFLLAIGNSAPLNLLDGLGTLLCLVGIIGESVADKQLQNFKRDPKNSGLVCQDGLWKYSRHPNYFFEWVIWCGFSFFGFSSGGGALSLLSPLLMYILLNYITGVPPAEAQSLVSKKELYREYQLSTSRFFPWFRNGK